MWLKEMIKKTFSDDSKITIERYKAAKFVFILSSFLFFMNFYLVWANFYLEIFGKTLGIIYIILLLSLVFYIYLFIKKLLIWKVPKYILIIILLFLFIIFLFVLLPVLLEWWLNTVIEFIKLYVKF